MHQEIEALQTETEQAVHQYEVMHFQLHDPEPGL